MLHEIENKGKIILYNPCLPPAVPKIKIEDKKLPTKMFANSLQKGVYSLN